MQKSANQNNKNAQFLLASMYSNGDGVNKNKQLALKWMYKKRY